ncbi:SLATT domain-containing protein [Hufsiella ginkgonis]|uniref:SLATT domain-containing protein n=1 Tax=Hufsiella ginkgonis TaxID=2695274 RepID=A0A7K1XYJ6_9SPHI|nr:SLATT domain-containing protein [Hufsiella ginkgonis]
MTDRAIEAGSLKKLVDKNFSDVSAETLGQAEWYQSRKQNKSRWSQTIRFASIVLIGLGGIFPLIGTINFRSGPVVVTNWGYIAIAIAGVLIFLDKFFGFSSTWIRYINAEMEIRKLLKEFTSKWQIEMARIELCNVELTYEKTVELLVSLRDFRSVIDELVKQETLIWTSEFQSNIAELQKIANTRTEATQPGAVRVVLKDHTAYQDISIKPGQMESRPFTGGQSLLKNMSVGPHEICLTAKKKTGQSIVIVKGVVDVEANKTAELQLEFPA